MAEELDHETTDERSQPPLGDTAVAVCPVGPRPGSAAGLAGRSPQVWTITVGIDNYANGTIPDSRTAARGTPSGSSGGCGGWAGTRHQLLLSDFGTTDPGEVAARRRSHPRPPWEEPGLGVPAMAGGPTHAPTTWWSSTSRGNPGRCPGPGVPGSTCRAISLPRDANPQGHRADRLVARTRGRPVRPGAQAPGRLLAGHRAGPTRPFAVPPAAARGGGPKAGRGPAAGGSPGIAWAGRGGWTRLAGRGRRPGWPPTVPAMGGRREARRPGHRRSPIARSWRPWGLRPRSAEASAGPTWRPPLKDLQEDSRLKLQGFCSGRRPALDDRSWPGDLARTPRTRGPLAARSSRPVTPTGSRRWPSRPTAG